MSYFWCSWSNRANGTVQASDAEAALKTAAEHGRNPKVLGRISYPANPRVAVESECPSFCYMPEKCSRADARGCWPNTFRRRSCDD